MPGWRGSDRGRSGSPVRSRHCSHWIPQISAAGLDTALVLVAGLGAAAAAIWGKRRYGWWAVFASFTGALWCVWAQQGVTLIEPYLLPPAPGPRDHRCDRDRRAVDAAIPPYATGLAIATVPVLGILAVVGTGDDATIPWRVRTARGRSGAPADRHGGSDAKPRVDEAPRCAQPADPSDRDQTASAGAIQAVRFGLRDDALSADALPACWSASLSAAGAVAAGAAARAIVDDAPGSVSPGPLASTHLPSSTWRSRLSLLKPGHVDWPAI